MVLLDFKNYRIVSNCGPLFIFSTKNYVIVCSKFIVYSCISTMLFVFPMVFTPFYPIYEFKFNVLVFLIMGFPQKLVLAPGATIRDNTVFDICF